MSDLRQERDCDTGHDLAPPHHAIRLKTLQAIRRRLRILRDQNSAPEFGSVEDLTPETGEYLKRLRGSLRKLRNENTLQGMQTLLKKLELELVQQGVAPEEHLNWVLEQLKNE